MITTSTFSIFFAPCPRGLETVLSEELESIGAQDIKKTYGGVSFKGPFSLCYEVNLKSRIASRVLWQVHHGLYRNEQDIYQAAHDLPWPNWFSVHCRIKVRVEAQYCLLNSLDFITLRIKDAICDKFRKVRGLRPSVDTSSPDFRIHAFLNAKDVILYLDTSGEPLFKRGLRKISGSAPLRENLAAGLLYLSGWKPDQALMDPMCGTGTILMEAAQMARNIAPGLDRRFAFQKLTSYDPATWRRLYQDRRSQAAPSKPLAIYGCDKQSLTIKAVQTNLKAAGFSDSITIQETDIANIYPPSERGIIVTNPPYGVRTGNPKQLATFYPQFGDVLKQRFPGWRAYIFTADPQFPKLIGLSSSRRTPLFNGDLECRLLEYKLGLGPWRQSNRNSKTN